jgi:hypothetical protein
VRIVLSVLVLLGLAVPAAWGIDPAPLPKEVKTARTAYILDLGVEPAILDNVYDQIKKWSRWILVDEREKADLLIVLSARNNFFGIVSTGSVGSATATATTIGNTTTVHATGAVQNTSVPLMSFPRYLALIDPRSGIPLVTVSTELRLSKGYTGRALVARLKKRFPRDQR